MKKKFVLGLMIVFLGVTLFGCGMSTLKLVQDNMSEITKVYYFGENENFGATISCGEREENYIMNGKSDKLVDFCLLSVKLNNETQKELIKAKVYIDDEINDCELLLNKKNKAYMIDLEKTLNGQEKIFLEIDGHKQELIAISNDFQIDYNNALKIASENLEDKIVKAKSFVNLNAECYLRVLDKNSKDLNGTYWCFSVFNVDGENFSIIISKIDGSVFAKSE